MGSRRSRSASAAGTPAPPPTTVMARLRTRPLLFHALASAATSDSSSLLALSATAQAPSGGGGRNAFVEAPLYRFRHRHCHCSLPCSSCHGRCGAWQGQRLRTAVVVASSFPVPDESPHEIFRHHYSSMIYPSSSSTDDRLDDGSESDYRSSVLAAAAAASASKTTTSTTCTTTKASAFSSPSSASFLDSANEKTSAIVASTVPTSLLFSAWAAASSATLRLPITPTSAHSTLSGDMLASSVREQMQQQQLEQEYLLRHLLLQRWDISGAWQGEWAASVTVAAAAATAMFLLLMVASSYRHYRIASDAAQSLRAEADDLAMIIALGFPNHRKRSSGKRESGMMSESDDGDDGDHDDEGAASSSICSLARRCTRLLRVSRSFLWAVRRDGISNEEESDDDDGNEWTPSVLTPRGLSRLVSTGELESSERSALLHSDLRPSQYAYALLGWAGLYVLNALQDDRATLRSSSSSLSSSSSDNVTGGVVVSFEDKQRMLARFRSLRDRYDLVERIKADGQNVAKALVPSIRCFVDSFLLASPFLVLSVRCNEADGVASVAAATGIMALLLRGTVDACRRVLLRPFYFVREEEEGKRGMFWNARSVSWGGDCYGHVGERWVTALETLPQILPPSSLSSSTAEAPEASTVRRSSSSTLRPLMEVRNPLSSNSTRANRTAAEYLSTGPSIFGGTSTSSSFVSSRSDYGAIARTGGMSTDSISESRIRTPLPYSSSPSLPSMATTKTSSTRDGVVRRSNPPLIRSKGAASEAVRSSFLVSVKRSMMEVTDVGAMTSSSEPLVPSSSYLERPFFIPLSEGKDHGSDNDGVIIVVRPAFRGEVVCTAASSSSSSVGTSSSLDLSSTPPPAAAEFGTHSFPPNVERSWMEKKEEAEAKRKKATTTTDAAGSTLASSRPLTVPPSSTFSPPSSSLAAAASATTFSGDSARGKMAEGTTTTTTANLDAAFAAAFASSFAESFAAACASSSSAAVSKTAGMGPRGSSPSQCLGQKNEGVREDEPNRRDATTGEASSSSVSSSKAGFPASDRTFLHSGISSAPMTTTGGDEWAQRPFPRGLPLHPDKR